jgi:hypothetical protein
VKRARDLVARIEGAGTELAKEAEAAERAGRPLRARARYLAIANEFPGGELENLARAQAARLEKDEAHRAAARAWKTLEKAVGETEKGKAPAEILARIDEAAGQSACAEVTEAVARLKESLHSDPAGLPATWRSLQP